MCDTSDSTVGELKININKICRMCISDKFILREIHQTRIPKMMESCASIQVCKDDGLPNHVCVKCFHLITRFYTFKKKVERNDRFLRKCLRNNAILNQNCGKSEVFNDVEPEETGTFKNGNHLNEDDVSVVRSQSTIEYNCSRKEETIQTANDGPPPLIPLRPFEKIELRETTINILPNDTPPLIPIKPLANLDLQNFQNGTIKYHCSTCNEVFETVESLKSHKFTKCQQNPLQCNICHKEFKDSRRLIGHLKGHMVSKDYDCTICGKRYPNPSTFTVHMRSHTGERPFKCEVCGKGFTRWAGVAGHMKSHIEDKPFKCDICLRYFKNSSNLARHKIRHTSAYPYCCKFCDKSFNQSDNLQVHIKTYHTNERPFLCNECGKAFVNSTRLNRHMWIHSGYKPYSCVSCPKRYSNMNDLKNHERRAHQGKNVDDFKKYPCDKCNMKFFHPCRLARHKKTHEKFYNCQFCGKPFAIENHLVTHLEEKHNWVYEKDMDIYVGYQEDNMSDKAEEIKLSSMRSHKENPAMTVVDYIYDSTV